MSKRTSFLPVLFSLLFTASAADWPTYRADAARSGRTKDALPAKLSLAWTYHPTHAPMTAWPRDDRMLFDRANEVVIAGGLLFFGNSADGQVTALDGATGEQRWTFFTDAPVRFAPAVWKDRLFVVSDDGCMYALALKDGALLGKWRGGLTDEMILGNGRMVARWPARGGPVILDDIVYFAAGIWQSDGVFIKAIDAASGKEIWCNDHAGKISMPQPHGGAVADSGVSAQGYIVATAEQLFVPTGRAVPAAFARADGNFQYYRLQANGRTGGTQTVAIGANFYNGGMAFSAATGDVLGKLGPGSVAALPEGVVHSSAKVLRVVEAAKPKESAVKGLPVIPRDHKVLASAAGVEGGAAVIVAGNTIVTGGGKTVTAIDAKSLQTLWSTEVDGTPHGLAAAGGRLYVSTDQGTFYCYDGGAHSAPAEVRPPQQTVATVDESYGAAADEIVKKSGVKDGYCLDLDCGDGSLALALAQRTNLQIYALNPSAEGVAAARKKLASTGLYGVRVTVHQGDGKRYGKYFADLVVSSRSLREGALAVKEEKPPHVLRPSGGVLCTGSLGAMKTITRGAVANAGSWTHQYSDAGNTSCSTDEVKGPLHALWFRDVDLEMPQRHGRGPAPLYSEGRMFVEGINELRAVDAYNGRSLWEFPLPGVLGAFSADHLVGTAVTGSNFCFAAGSIYVHDKKHCYRLDAVTGKKLGEFAAPKTTDGQPGQWGYIACDGKFLYGSLSNPKHLVRYAFGRSDMSELWGESSALFVLDAITGKMKWRYDARESIRNNAIALGAGRVLLIDRVMAAEDVWDPRSTEKKLSPIAKVQHPSGLLLALDAETGKTLWQSDKDIFGTMLAFQPEHDALLMCYQSTRFKLPSELGGRLTVLRGSDGTVLWQKEAAYTTRPLINGRTIYAQGGAWDLVNGGEQPFTLQRSYGCGQFSGSKNLLLFRSATLGYTDFTRGSGTENFGGIRPGCWINALPVGGLVLLPDASAGCSCSYQNRSWMALAGED